MVALPMLLPLVSAAAKFTPLQTSMSFGIFKDIFFHYGGKSQHNIVMCYFNEIMSAALKQTPMSPRPLSPSLFLPE